MLISPPPTFATVIAGMAAPAWSFIVRLIAPSSTVCIAFTQPKTRSPAQ
jgi:hypothetical protein